MENGDDSRITTEETVASFAYSQEDFVMQVKAKDDQVPILSKFDKFLQMKWKAAMSNGMFRYNLDALECRVLDGVPKLVLQRNPKRGLLRREPEEITSVQTPFDHSKFNFNKIHSGEILGYFQNTQNITELTNHSFSEEEKKHLLIINASPLDFGHILLVPEAKKCLPQTLSLLSLQLGAELILLSADWGFRVAFNGLCALASVNHQHLHAWYTHHHLTIENTPVKQICGCLYETAEMPVNAFTLQLGNITTAQFAQQIFLVTNYLQQSDVAHNVLFTRGTSFSSSESHTIRVYIWPRKKHKGNKLANLPPFNIAVAELGGQVPVYDDSFYTMTHTDVIHKLEEVRLSEEEYEHIKQNIVKHFAAHNS